jgi:ABC-type polysaccharide/polyol phosphate transport system ATPase subunit
MSKLAIRVEELGKLYHIGALRGAYKYKTLRESLIQAMTAPLQRLLNPKSRLNGSDTIWALRDVNFEVEQGDVSIDGVSVHTNYDGKGESRVLFLKQLEIVEHPRRN